MHILFDWDYTLWDFKTNSEISLTMLYNKHNLNQYYSSFSEFHNSYKTVNDELWSLYARGEVSKDYLAVERFAIPFSKIGLNDRKLAETFNIEYLTHNATQTALMPNAQNVVEALHKRGHKISIITNGFKEVQHLKIQHSNLAPFIYKVFVSEEIGAMKPSQNYFQSVLNALNTDAENCIVVGDSPESDIEGALKMNIKAVFYNSRNITNPYSSNPNVISITNLLNLLTVL